MCKQKVGSWLPAGGAQNWKETAYGSEVSLEDDANGLKLVSGEDCIILSVS